MIRNKPKNVDVATKTLDAMMNKENVNMGVSAKISSMAPSWVPSACTNAQQYDSPMSFLIDHPGKSAFLEQEVLQAGDNCFFGNEFNATLNNSADVSRSTRGELPNTFRPATTSSPIPLKVSTESIANSMLHTLQISPEIIDSKKPSSSNLDVVNSESLLDSKKLLAKDNLRGRWEFSSATGTPLHPDSSHDELLQAAIDLKRNMLPVKPTRPRAFSATTPSTVYSPVPKNALPLTPTECPAPNTSPPVSPKLESSKPRNTSPQILYCAEQSEIYVTETVSPLIINANFTPKGFRATFVDAVEVCEESDICGHSSRGTSSHELRADNLSCTASTSKSEHVSPVSSKTNECHNESTRSENNDPVNVAKTSEDQVPELAKIDKAENVNELEYGEGQGTLLHSVSFYRHMQANRRHDNLDKVVFAGAETSPEEAEEEPIFAQISPMKVHMEKQKQRKQMAVIKERMDIEKVKLQQGLAAVQHCISHAEFKGGSTEIDAHTVVLVARQSHFTLLRELEVLRSHTRPIFDAPRGCLEIRNVTIQLNENFLGHQGEYFNHEYFFVATFASRDDLVRTKAISSASFRNGSGRVELCPKIVLSNLTPDFAIDVEIFGLRTVKKIVEADEKPSLMQSVFKRNLSRNAKKQQSTKCEIDPEGFRKIGYTRITHATSRRSQFELKGASHPITHRFLCKLKKYPVNTGSSIVHRGFLSLYQKSSTSSIWTRYWAEMRGAELKFWKFPEDVNVKSCLAVIDLSTAAGDIRRNDQAGDFPFSFYVELFVERTNQDAPRVDTLKVQLAADHKESYNVWIAQMSAVIENWKIWNDVAI